MFKVFFIFSSSPSTPFWAECGGGWALGWRTILILKLRLHAVGKNLSELKDFGRVISGLRPLLNQVKKNQVILN